jgi:hypothetical protein
MRKLFIFFCSALSIFNSAFSIGQQAPAIEWQKCLGGTFFDQANSIQQTNDGGYIVGGKTFSNDSDVIGNNGLWDAWVVKLDPVGNFQWQKCLGGTNDDFVFSIQQTIDDGYIVAGYTKSTNGDVSGNHGGVDDAWIVKLDTVGNIQWQKCLGGTGSEQANAIKQTADGGYIVVGFTTSNDGDVSGNHSSNSDCWVVKLDASGNIQWQKCLGGTNFEIASAIQQTSDGGYVVAGITNSNDGDVSGNHGGNDYWVAKLDAVANLQWQKCMGGTNNDYNFSIQQTIDGGYIAAGYTQSNDGNVSGNHGYNDSWIVKLNGVGNLQWQKCLGGTSKDVSNTILQTNDGEYVVVGYTQSNDGDVSGNHFPGYSDCWVVKLDTGANLLWQKCLGGTDYDFAYSMQQTTDGGYIVAGYTASNDGDISGYHGGQDMWIVKLYPDSTTGMDNLQFTNSELNVFPNPAKYELTITGYTLNNGNAIIKMYDVLGNEVYNKTVNNATVNVNTNNLSPGMYIVQINTGSTISRSRFVKE